MFWIPDRFWWVYRYAGLLLVLGSLAGAVFNGIQAYDNYNSISQFPWEAEILRDFARQEVFSSLMAAFTAFFSVSLVWWSSASRGRFRRRLRAIGGDQEALPCAKITVDAERVPNLASGPLELLWRATVFSGRIMTMVIAVIAVIFGPLAGLFWYLAYCLATNTPPIGSTSVESVSPLDRIVGVAVTVSVGLGLLFLVAFVLWYLPWERGKSYGVTANNEGLWYYPKGWKRRFLRWEEVCLLEASITKGGQQYRVYGRHTPVTWLKAPPSKWVELGMSKGEFEQHHQALLDLVAARTGLVPRTLDKRLMEAGSGVGR